MIIQENYNERLDKGTFDNVSKVELLNIIKYFKESLSIKEKGFNHSSEFYSLLRKELPYKIQVENDLDIIQYFDRIGKSKIDLDKNVFIIWESPNQITNIKIRDLHIQWEEIWCPPADDGLVILIPNEKCFLITDYGTLYYN